MSLRRSVVIALLGVCAVASPAGAASARTAPPSPRVRLPSCGPNERVVLAKPDGQAYHTAYFSSVGRETGYTSDRIAWWERLTGRPVAGVYFSNHWGTERGAVHIAFPTKLVRTIWRHGAVPMVRMMPWSKLWVHGADPTITMQRIVDGRFDRPLRRWFHDAAEVGIPLFVDLGVEVNGEWFPWNGKWNGGGTTDGYGSPRWPDGPERFRDAYRHVVDLARTTRAGHLITWDFHVDSDGWPKRWWNQPKWYYPGDAYVDWLTVSDYGEQVPSGKPSHWNAFVAKLGDPADPSSSYRSVRRLAPDKPFGVTELGVTEDPAAGDKASWITDAYAAMTPPTARYDVSLVSYWSEKWTNTSGKLSDLRVQSSPGALDAYRTAIADPFFATAPTFACVPG
ncbi:MAG: glycosyl hydrolase [Actinomycetota bacterium]